MISRQRKDDSERILDGDEPDLLALKDRFDHWSESRRKAGYPEKWRLAELLTAGYNQYSYNPISRRIEAHPQLSRFDEQWLNMIEPLIDMKASKIASVPNRFEVVPLSSNEIEIEKAAAGNSLIGHFQWRLHHREMVKKVCRLTRIYSIVYLHSYWDPTANADLALFDDGDSSASIVQALLRDDPAVLYKGVHMTQSGPVHVLEGPFGDVNAEVVLPYNVFIPAGAQDLESAENFIRTSIRSLAWVERNYPDVAENVRSQEIQDTRTGADYSGLMNFGDFSSPVDAINGTALSDQAGFIKVFEYWERNEAGGWSRALCIENTAYEPINSSQSPYYVLAQDYWEHHGYTQCPVPSSAHDAYPRSDVMRVAGLQRRIDETYANMAVNQRVSARPVLLSSGQNNPEVSRAESFIVVRHRGTPGGQPLQLQNMPNNQDQQYKYMNMLIESMKSILGLLPISFGQTGNLESGRGVTQLREEQGTTLMDERESIDLGFSKFYERMLGLAYENYDIHRVVGLLDDNYDAHVIMRDLLHLSPRVRVVASKILPLGLSERWEVATRLLESGMFNPQNYEITKGFLQFVTGGLDDVRAVLSEPYKIKNACEYEHRAIEDGRTFVQEMTDPQTGQPTGEQVLAYVTGEPVVNDTQEHAMEMAEHRRFSMSSAARNRWTPEQRRQLGVLISNHQTMLNQAQQAATQGEIQAEAARGQVETQGKIAVEQAKAEGLAQVERVKGEMELLQIQAKFEADTQRRLAEIGTKGKIEGELKETDYVLSRAEEQLKKEQGDVSGDVSRR